jgi:UDP-N-acetylmuramoylalanine--D-glutamate ligase
MKKIVILGSGESGVGAAILAQQVGYQVFVSERGAMKPQYKADLEKHGIEYEENQHTMKRIFKAKEVIKSPGIPEKTEIMQTIRAKGIPVIGEIEFAYRYAGKCAIVAITGSNGKTTTTMLTQHLLVTAGLNTRMGGNVGNSFAAMIAEDRLQKKETSDRIFVLELSSFQLDDCVKFKPDIAVLLNVTPDHLDRYDYELENYTRSKFSITKNQKRSNLFIYNGLDPIMNDYILRNNFESKAKKEVIKKGFYKKLEILIGSKHRFTLANSKLRGPHNLFNASCALRIALRLGADADLLQKGLDSFETPPHRLEFVATKNGITYINDSKATNVDSVFYALQAMEKPTVWIVGGQDKGNDYSPLFKDVKKKVKAIVCMGVDNTKLLEVFGTFKKPIKEAKSMKEAIEIAEKMAKNGDTILLSPACASFDLFKNYEDRGNQFREKILDFRG